MAQVDLRMFKPAVLAYRAQAISQLLKVFSGEIAESYKNAFEDQIREAEKMLKAIREQEEGEGT